MKEYTKKLYLQIVESYGRILYTYQCYLEMVNIINKINIMIKRSRIILSAIMTGSFFTSIFGDSRFVLVVGTSFSIILLAINLYYKDAQYQDDINKFTCASNDLWLIKEKYLCLLTDFDQYELSQLKNKRDILINDTDQIYRKYSKTNNLAFIIARYKIKRKEVHKFEDGEFLQLLPTYLNNIEDKDDD
ncbi:MAG: SLATT domain-containing protein [Lachnospiraceae bacterium]